MKKFLSIVISMVIFFGASVHAVSTHDEEEKRPLLVIEVSVEQIAKARLEFDILGIIQKVSPVPIPSSSIRFKKSKNEKINLATKVPSLLIKNKISETSSKIDSNKISKAIAKIFNLDTSAIKQLNQFIKDGLELTPNQLSEAFLGIDGVLNYNGTDIAIHIGFENIGNYFLNNILDGVLLEK